VKRYRLTVAFRRIRTRIIVAARSRNAAVAMVLASHPDVRVWR
jgi:hypothetical protein